MVFRTDVRSGGRRRVLWTSIALLVVVVLVIAVPIAVILPRKRNSTTRILLPLYIYPENSTSWQPLYDAFNTRPELQYTVIINPKTGPVAGTPDEQYAAELLKLSNYSNLQTVGYVRTGYASRNISDILNEINLYANWSSVSENYAMHGIFFDESPHVYSAAAVTLMRTATSAVKKSKGLLGAKTVIRNPGVIPDKSFSDANTDISVVFEESYSQYQNLSSQLNKDLSNDRSTYAYMIHSTPSMSLSDLKKFVGRLKGKAAYLFVTSNVANYYEKFAGDWGDLVGAM